MSSVIEAIVNGDIVYEVTLDQPASIYEVTISDTAPNYEVIEFNAGMLSLALIQDSSPSSVKTYSSTKIEAMIGSGLTTADIGTTVQPYDLDLTSWAGIAPSAKQDTLTFDLVPTDASTNPVQSNGIFDALALKSDTTHSHTLDGLSDVVVPTPTSGDVLSWNGTSWVNTVPSAGGSSTLTIDNKIAAYTVISTDLGKIINCTSGTFTVSLTAAATLGAGFNCWIWNSSITSTDTITIDPNSTETIDGFTIIILRPSEGVQLLSNGTNWFTNSERKIQLFANNFSSAVGFNLPTASGSGSVAIGPSAAATALYSIAIGRSSSATSSYAFATSLSTASSNYSTAMGLNSGATGSQAVTGAGAMALGGSYASGTDSFAAAIANNTSSYGATGTNSVAIGSLAKASGSYSFSGGYQNTASGIGSVSLGGVLNTASGKYSYCYGDRGVSSINGKVVIGYGIFDTAGDCQAGKLGLKCITTDATLTILSSDANAASTSNQEILPNNSAFVFSGIVVSRQSQAQGTSSAAWRIEGLIIRGVNAASTVLVASTVTAISNAPAWTLALSANTTRGGLEISFTGATSTNIRTVATIETSEVVYA